ncbi:MAG: hypothetical protein EXR98_23170, partial [Gemmataceae bacterium]|nr:hypothetical protein [Gemmataceae bacterium]
MALQLEAGAGGFHLVEALHAGGPYGDVDRLVAVGFQVNLHRLLERQLVGGQADAPGHLFQLGCVLDLEDRLAGQRHLDLAHRISLGHKTEHVGERLNRPRGIARVIPDGSTAAGEQPTGRRPAIAIAGAVGELRVQEQGERFGLVWLPAARLGPQLFAEFIQPGGSAGERQVAQDRRLLAA